MTTKNLMKRVMPLALALVMVLSVVLVPAGANAAERKPSGVAAYTLTVGEQWYAPVFFTQDDAVIASYKIAKKKVATVDEEGLVTANKKGKCKLVTTVKQGGKTYKIKTKITVKNSITMQEFVERAYPEFVAYYQMCFDAAYENGWVFDDGSTADDLYGPWLKNYYTVVAGVEKVLANPGSKTDEELQQIYDELMYPIMEGVSEAYTVFSVPFEG